MSASLARARKAVTLPVYRAAAATAVALAVTVVLPRAAEARQDVVTRGATERTVTLAAARGIAILQSNGGQRYLMPTVSWGRVLTDGRGPAFLRGRFEWAVELTPLFAEWSPGHARGVAVAPLQWRWNLAAHGRLHPFLEVGGGAVWTSAPIPAGTTGSNFMTHGGAGLRLLGRDGHGLIAGYRLHHISNGNRLRQNPGVNAHMLTVGYTWMARP